VSAAAQDSNTAYGTCCRRTRRARPAATRTTSWATGPESVAAVIVRRSSPHDRARRYVSAPRRRRLIESCGDSAATRVWDATVPQAVRSLTHDRRLDVYALRRIAYLLERSRVGTYSRQGLPRGGDDVLATDPKRAFCRRRCVVRTLQGPTRHRPRDRGSHSDRTGWGIRQ